MPLRVGNKAQLCGLKEEYWSLSERRGGGIEVTFLSGLWQVHVRAKTGRSLRVDMLEIFEEVMSRIAPFLLTYTGSL